MMCVQEQILPYVFFLTLLFLSYSFFSFSKIHKCNQHKATTMSMYDAIECSLPLSLSFPMIESMNEYAKKKKKEKNLSIECDSRLYYICLCIQQPWTSVRTGRCRVKWDITSIFKTLCSFFHSFFSFYILFDTLISIKYAIFLLFFSCKLLFKHTFMHIYT
jgi:hypothetical protein